jgi:FkbM family methyltransferase
LGNLLYRYFQFVYKPLYFQYKNIAERNKIRFLRSVINQEMTILDIGANIGFYTVLFSKLVKKKGKVFAFEPDALNYKNLVRNTKRSDNVRCYNAAVGEITKDAKLYISCSLNVDHQTYNSGEEREYVDIRMIALDDLMDDFGKIDLIKVDIQGYDYYALLGMKKIIAQNPQVKIVGEFWPYGLSKANINPSDYLSLLKELGFKVKFFKGNNEEYYKDKHYYNDFIAVKI